MSRKTKVNPALIPMFVAEGLSNSEIAAKMGWTIGTFQVQCSKLKISLRQLRRGMNNLALPSTVLESLSRRAGLIGVSTSELGAKLLAAIERDNLYNAVLDDDRIAPDDMTLASRH